MSMYSGKTILKNYSSSEREKAKSIYINKVRFALPKSKEIKGIIESVINVGNYVAYDEFVSYLKEVPLNDNEFLRTISEARANVHLLNSTFSALVETLLSLDWKKRNKTAILEYCEFYVDLLFAHSKYTSFAISVLISNLVPNEKDAAKWINACPNEEVENELKHVHCLLERLLDIIPMTYDIVLNEMDNKFPYYRKQGHVLGGYIHNIFWLLEYKPAFAKHVIELIFKQLILLDVNAPRNEIEDAEFQEEVDGAMFLIEGCGDDNDDTVMKHPVAETLDVCMLKMFDYIQRCTTPQTFSNYANIATFFKLYFTVFEDVILPSHNTHHAQFIMFYMCSLKPFLAEQFLSNLWTKITNPNVSAPIRQTSIGYIASFLARANFISLSILRNYLFEMCSWAHNYIQQSDSVRSNKALKANIVFFSICQAIFYIIAFRCKDLTHDKKSLLFLQSLQLSALVTSNFNPLRVCISAVATAFAGVTRTYQLAYCHAILERNARRKLATVYANDTSMPEESLETFFPFDPYLLKKSGQRIKPIYLQYVANEVEDETAHIDTNSRRKRGDSEVDDIDDFIIDKKQKLSELSRSNDKEFQFTYGLSPGFHI